MLYSILKKTLPILLLLLIRTEALADNAVTIEQVTSGNSNSITIAIEGSGNKTNFSFGGANNTVNIEQKGKDAYVGYTTAWGSGALWGGDLDGDSNSLTAKQLCNQSVCGGDRFEFHIAGNSNNVAFYQGYGVTTAGVTNYDTIEYGGHFKQLDIHGSNNTLIGSQRSNNSGHEHSMTTGIYGNNNDIYMRQENNQDKTMNLTINNSYNDVDMVQIGNAGHSATVTIGGAYSTTFNMLQQGGTAQTYSLTQDCQTSGGCSVSVTQGN